MVEGAALEMRYTRKSIVSSNLTSSASWEMETLARPLRVRPADGNEVNAQKGPRVLKYIKL